MNENKINKEIKYYIVKNKKLAMALEYVTQQQAYKFPNQNYDPDFDSDDKKYVYSFVNNEKFQKAYTVLIEARNVFGMFEIR